MEIKSRIHVIGRGNLSDKRWKICGKKQKGMAKNEKIGRKIIEKSEKKCLKAKTHNFYELKL